MGKHDFISDPIAYGTHTRTTVIYLLDIPPKSFDPHRDKSILRMSYQK